MDKSSRSSPSTSALFPRLEIRDLRQHHVEKAARFARLDHRDIHARNVSGDFASRSPATCVHHEIVDLFHFAFAAGAEASLCKITSARLNGTPAASKLDSNRVKFSSSFAETFLDAKSKVIFPNDDGAAEPFFPAELFSDKFTGRRPSVSSAAARRDDRRRPARLRQFCRRTARLCRKTWAWELDQAATAMLAAEAPVWFFVALSTSFAVVTLNTSSTVVTPAATRRQPSSASVRIPALRAAARI